VRAVIGLGRGLDLPVIAEGVETEDQRSFLLSESCSAIQGFLIGRPLPMEHYARLVGRKPEADSDPDAAASPRTIAITSPDYRARASLQ
jgi:EAL domain-containing protein (putative c-di-GMP-specific phosphodiesterase class I)